MIVVAACINGDEAPPLTSASALSVTECPGLPAASFIEDALLNFAGMHSSDPDAIDVLFDIIGLGTSAEGIFDLVSDLRAGSLDAALWPSLIDLSPTDAERTMAAAIIEIDPNFELRCGLLRRFSEGQPKTVTDLALIVNQSHDFPVSDEEMLGQPFERKSLMWEIATALDRVQGIRPPGGRHGVNASPDTEVESPLIQLLSAFRGAHNAFFGRERPWAHRPFGRPQAAFDKLVVLLGAPVTDAGFIGPGGGELYGEGALEGVVLTIPPGALEEDVFIEILHVLIGPRPTGGRVPVGPMVELSPSEIVFTQPVVLTLPYVRRLAASHGIGQSSISVSRYDETAEEWLLLPSWMEERRVTVELDGFSLFQAVTDDPTQIEVWTLAEREAEQGAWGILDVAVPSEGSYYGGWAFVVTTDGRLAMAVEQFTDAQGVQRAGFFVLGDDLPIPRPELLPEQLPFFLPVRRVSAVAAHGGYLYVGLEAWDYFDLSQSRTGFVFGLDMRAPDNIAEMTIAEIDADLSGRQWERIAGGGEETGEDVPAADLWLGAIGALATDDEGRIYVAEHESPRPWGPLVWGDRVRRIEASGDRLVNTIAGAATSGFNGDGPMPATEAKLYWGRGLAASTMMLEEELLFIADTGNHRVRAVNLGESTVALGEHVLEPGELVTVMGFGLGLDLVHFQIGLTCLSFRVEGVPTGGATARTTLVDQPVGLAIAGRDLLVSDKCLDRIWVMPLTLQERCHPGEVPPD